MTHLRQGYGGQGAYDCPREQDVVNAVLGGRWPDRCDESLVTHAASCITCREVAQVSMLLHEDVDHARIDVIVPAAGQIWWRSAVRARLEAAQAATRPMTWLHGIAGACAIGLTWALAGVVWPSVRELAAWLAAQTFGVDSGLGDVAALVTAALQKSLPLAFVVAACIVLAPVALYFALSDDNGH